MCEWVVGGGKIKKSGHTDSEGKKKIKSSEVCVCLCV